MLVSIRIRNSQLIPVVDGIWVIIYIPGVSAIFPSRLFVSNSRNVTVGQYIITLIGDKIPNKQRLILFQFNGTESL